jgi:hypothetical protein
LSSAFERAVRRRLLTAIHSTERQSLRLCLSIIPDVGMYPPGCSMIDLIRERR